MRKIIRSGLWSIALCLVAVATLAARPAIAAEGKYDPLSSPKQGTLSWDLEQRTPYWTLSGKKYTSRVRACKDPQSIDEIQKVLVANKEHLKRGVALAGQLSDRFVSEHKCVVFQAPIDYTVVEIMSTDLVVNISPDPALNQKRKLGVAEIKIDGSPKLFMSIMLPYDPEFSI